MINILYIFLVSSIIYSQCDYEVEFYCSSDINCNWVEDIESGNCSNLSSNNCNSTPGCDWVYDCIQWGWWYDWCYEYGYECTGGTYQFDNGYCEEIPYEMGDINGDLSIDVMDIIETVNLIINGEYDSTVDMDNNFQINVLDIIQIIGIILDS